jgi:glycosyl transferase family 1
MRPRVLAALPGVFPSTVINVAKPLLRLHEAGAIDLELSFHFVVRRRQIERADVLVMSHTINPAYVWILDCAREAGTPLVYDIDENLLEPPADEPGLDFHRAPARQAAVRQALSQAAVVRTYAPALARYLAPFNAHVVRTDGPVGWRLVPPAPPARDADRVQVVYATSRLRDPIGAVLARPLLRVLDEHPNVDVTIWGPRFPELDSHPRVRARDFVRDYDRYFEQFAGAGFDIGLAPMPDDLFYQCKTATKFREYAACRIAGVYSDTEMYRDCVTDGETGLLVPRGDDAWVAAVGRLIRDTALRSRIQERALAYARERYAAERIEGDWLAHIEAARHQPSAISHDASTVRHEPSAISGEPSGVSRPSSLNALWARARLQMTNVRQLLAWELALHRRRH